MRAGLFTSIPSPAHNQVYVGPIPLRGYALCLLLAIVAGLAIGERRLRRRGYRTGAVADLAVWSVPFGLVGARIDHVTSDHRLYFGHGRDWVRSFAIWDGGLSIWGAVALGAVGAWFGCRRHRVRLSHLADAMAVGLPVAQAIGRWGNWFNQELYGRPSSLPWAVRIDAAHRLPQYAADATFQPTFLYESIWDLGVAGFVLLAERRQWFGQLSRGRAFALYVAAYTIGRGCIETLRVDPEPHLLGVRLGDVIAVVLFVLATGYLVLVRPGGGAAEGRSTTDSLSADDLLADDLLADDLRADDLPAGTAGAAPAHPSEPGPDGDAGLDQEEPDDERTEQDEHAASPLDALRSPLRER